MHGQGSGQFMEHKTTSRALVNGFQKEFLSKKKWSNNVLYHLPQSSSESCGGQEIRTPFLQVVRIF